MNRHSELFDLFHANAAVILKLLDRRARKKHIDNWRPCSVAVAAQMFGSGKTTLGRNLYQAAEGPGNQQLHSREVDRGRLEGRVETSTTCRIKALQPERLAKTMYDVAIKLDYGQFKDLSSAGALHIAQHIFALAAVTGEKPLFVHFDEIGDLQDNVRELRETVRQVWGLMLQHQGDMPRICFYLSGKSVPLNAIGGSGSPVPTKWIILDLLKELLPVLR